MAMNPTTWTAAKRKAQSKKIKAAWKRRKAAKELTEAGKKLQWGKGVINSPAVQAAQLEGNWKAMNYIEEFKEYVVPPHLKVMDLKYNPHFEEEVTASDMVNHPAHYTATKYEAADVADEWYANEPHLWNANKYMVRWDKKGDPVENLEKAIWYIQRKISKLKEK